MASWKLLVVAVFLGNVVSGLSQSEVEEDDDDSFDYSTQPLMMFPALPLPIPSLLLPQFDQMFPPIRMPRRPTRPTPPTPPTPVNFHHFRHHPFRHRKPVFEPIVFPDFVTADTVLDEKPDGDSDFAGYAVRRSSGGDDDGTTMVTNDNGEVDSASTGKKTHNMRQRIKVPKLKNSPGNHHTAFSKSSSSSSNTVNGVTVSDAESSTMADDDGKVEEEHVKVKKGPRDSGESNEWKPIRKPTPPKKPTDFPDLPDISASGVLDTKPGDGEEFSGTAIRSDDDGTTMVTNENGDVKEGQIGKKKRNMRKPILPPKLKGGPGNHHTSFSTSTSSSSKTVNGVTVSEGDSQTVADDDGKIEQEQVAIKKKGKANDGDDS